ncbi:MAG: hypothetical protein JWM00_425 [Candidatus Saccharibacteria bacterium]|nr:hypothetical protein [Candidatus Saccharibacteria bacterium]
MCPSSQYKYWPSDQLIVDCPLIVAEWLLLDGVNFIECLGHIACTSSTSLPLTFILWAECHLTLSTRTNLSSEFIYELYTHMYSISSIC